MAGRARGRWVKPETFTSNNYLQPLVRLHWIGLWTYADDEGRGIDNPRLLKAAIWPLDDEITHVEIASFQEALEAANLIIRYSVHGTPLFQVRNWREHQSVPKPKASTLPPPDQWKQDVPSMDSTVTVRFVDDYDPRTGPSSSSSSSASDRTPLRKQRERDLAFEALCSVSNIDWRELTPSGRGAINRALREIREVYRDTETLPDEIQRRAENLQHLFSHIPVTASSLAKHWAAAEGAPPPKDTAGKLRLMADKLRKDAQDG